MTTVSPNEPKMHKHKAETPAQSSPVAYKPYKSVAIMTTKVTATVMVTLTLPQKTSLLMFTMIEVDSEIKKTLSLDKDFFVEDAPDKAFVRATVRGHLEAFQNTLVVSRGDILS